MKKNHELRVKVSQEELEKLKGKADKLGLKVSTFLRLVGLSATINTINGL